ncbi:MAG TPA: hypothetical protein DEH25_05550 [Chloroflexi bacterium]|nr:hypothetical protein [Chloroflexota bacterium]HBY07132.1 hypothetical protein [Chloroflexota bacterium]
MSKPQPTIPLQLRLFAILLGVVFLFWLPIEDTSAIAALIFSMVLSAWIAIAVLIIPNKPFSSPLSNYILAGTLVGIAITPLTLFWMAFKSGLHSHPIPDFTPQTILSVIERTPIWLIGSFLIGLGSGILHTYRKAKSQTTSE